MSPETDSFTVQVWIDRLREGDDSAREALLARAFDRLRRLARKMLKGYPGVGCWEQTDDVLQNAMIRLNRALRSVAPPTAKDFFRLAAAEIRRELIDLARHYRGRGGIGAHHSSLDGADLPETTHDPGRLAEWTEFHQRVDALPDEDREIIDLLCYQGLTQADAAAALGVLGADRQPPLDQGPPAALRCPRRPPTWVRRTAIPSQGSGGDADQTTRGAGARPPGTMGEVASGR